MEKIKEPAMLLSLVNSFGLVGLTAYCYKQLEAQRLELMIVTKNLSAIANKLTQMEKGERDKVEIYHSLNDQIKNVSEQVQNMPSINEIENFEEDFQEIVAVLQENNISVERPSQMQRYRRSGDRRSSQRNFVAEDRYNSSGKRSVSNSRSNTIDEMKLLKRRGRGIQENRTEPGNFDDDVDLINLARQQTR